MKKDIIIAKDSQFDFGHTSVICLEEPHISHNKVSYWIYYDDLAEFHIAKDTEEGQMLDHLFSKFRTRVDESTPVIDVIDAADAIRNYVDWLRIKHLTPSDLRSMLKASREAGRAEGKEQLIDDLHRLLQIRND